MKKLGIPLIALSAFLGGQAVAKPLSPSPVPNFCINKLTGAMRDSATCRKTEVSISLDSLLALAPATPEPSPASPSPDPTATATPVDNQPEVVDANGTVVGPFMGGSPPEDEFVFLTINGVGMDLAYAQTGFVDEALSGVPVAIWYTTPDCSGQPYLSVANDANGNGILPVVEVADGQTAPFVVGSVVWYAQPPFANTTMHSLEDFNNPASSPGDGCNDLDTTGSATTLVAGPPASFDLSTLGFVPPFSVTQ